MGKGLSGQREVVFLPDHHAAALISEVTVVVLFPDPYHGRGVQVSLHHMYPGKGIKVFREGRRDKFPFDFHRVISSGQYLCYDRKYTTEAYLPGKKPGQDFYLYHAFHYAIIRN